MHKQGLINDWKGLEMECNTCIICGEPIEPGDDLNCGEYHKHYDNAACRSATPRGYRRVDVSVVIQRKLNQLQQS